MSAEMKTFMNPPVGTAVWTRDEYAPRCQDTFSSAASHKYVGRYGLGPGGLPVAAYGVSQDVRRLDRCLVAPSRPLLGLRREPKRPLLNCHRTSAMVHLR